MSDLSCKSGNLERLYSIIKWVEDLHTDEGRKRLKASIDVFRKIKEHRWFKELVSKKRKIKLLDVCGGTGIGGLALAKTLLEIGLEIDLVVNDLRKDALSKAKIFSKEILGKEASVILDDATRLHKHGLQFDIALLYGLTTPHFSPYDMVKLISSVSKVLVPSGLFLLEETDRLYNIFYLLGYKDLVIEGVDNERIVLSLHVKHDVRKGTFERMTLNLIDMSRTLNDVYYWDVASTAALLWVFFADVDYIPIGKETRGMLISTKPRSIDVNQYQNYPAIIASQQ